MNGLMLHCGGQQRSRDEVFTVPVPVATPSYVPLPYESFVTRIEKELAVNEIDIVEERFALAKNGQRLFGLIQLRIPGIEANGYGCVLGLRNSYDKSFASGLCIGATVFVCDNLSFSGSSITFERKHTANLLRDLAWIITQTVAELPVLFAAQSRTFETYRAMELTDAKAHDAIIRCYDAGALNVTDIPTTLKEWREPRHPEFQSSRNTAWCLFNAVTETVKGDLWRLPARTRALHGVLDGICGLAPAKPEDVVLAV